MGTSRRQRITPTEASSPLLFSNLSSIPAATFTFACPYFMGSNAQDKVIRGFADNRTTSVVIACRHPVQDEQRALCR